ncbi:MAG: M24 family metallopeptidase [Bacteroidales bacterium]
MQQTAKDICEIVLSANMEAIKATGPGVSNRDVHLLACRDCSTGLNLGLMKGNVDDAVAAGAHALFLPHGLGHMMGMDVHDMEVSEKNYGV